MNYTLITGASRGIGRDLAHECASRMMNLILVARSLNDLVELKNEIAEHHSVDVQCLQLDLLDAAASDFIVEYLDSNSLGLNCLINNAGVGLYGDFDRSDLTNNLNMIHLNVNMLVNLTHKMLPFLQANSDSYVLNVSSLAALQPMPRMSTYSASKSFIYSFSRAIRNELNIYGVNVSCLCPGPTTTSFGKVAGMKDKPTGLLGIFSKDSKYVAKMAIKGMFKKKPVIIPGFMNKIQFLISSMLPSRISTRLANMMIKNQGRNRS